MRSLVFTLGVAGATAQATGTNLFAKHAFYVDPVFAQRVDALLSDGGLRQASRRASSSAAAALEHGVLDAIWDELQGPLRLPQAARGGLTGK